MANKTNNRHIIGWREWISLPGLGLPHIKAKIDTGARTSALHAFFVEPFEKDGRRWLRFGIHPWQRNSDIEVVCEAPLVEERTITDSGGHKEQRYVVETTVNIGPVTKTIEITLTNRDTMLFRMLLGRTALESDFIVDPEHSYLLGKRPEQPKKVNT